MPRRSSSRTLRDDQPFHKVYPTPIIVKFDDPEAIPHEMAADRALTGEMQDAGESLSRRLPDITLQPLHQNQDLTNIQKLIESARENEPEYRAPNVMNYFVVQLPSDFDGTSLARKLSAMPGVQKAHVEAGPVDPPVSAKHDPDYDLQGYLLAAPEGIDAVYAADSMARTNGKDL